jgi:hypothetical protein
MLIIQIGTMSSHKQQLKVNEEKGVLTLQTDGFAVQAIFGSTSLEVCNLQEQLEKYRYRAALSSINLKLDEFDHYYGQLKTRAEELYSSLLYHSLTVFQDLIIAVKFAKSELWHQEAKVVEGLKSHLYLKHLDPYDFKPEQFDEKCQAALDTLSAPTSQLEKSRALIEQFSREIKGVEAERMEDMYGGRVSSPYLAQNKDGEFMDPSSMYSSYFSHLFTKMERSEESLFRKHFLIREHVIKFGQALFDQSLKFQRNAIIAIRR